MAKTAVVKTLEWAHQTEVLGEALYATAARLTRDESRRRKWQALAQLETTTKASIRQALIQARGSTRERGFDKCVGQAAGFLAAMFPWRVTLRVVRVVASSTVERFEQLEREANDEDRVLFEELTAHERAQCDFAERELAGDGLRSIEPILALLDRAEPPSSDRAV